ncbi:S1 RNA-binding domain-containing protein [Yinghuangia aomiensis]
MRILGISGVTENRNFYYDAILLVFKDDESNTLRLGVEVDGTWSEPHAAAMEAIGAVERLRLSAAPVEHPHEPVTDPGARLGKEDVVALQSGEHATGEDEDGALDRAAVRWLGVYEHPQWLADAVANSRRRLLISSPRIRATVANDRWIRSIETLSRTVDVTIVWGLDDNSGTDQEALDALHAAARRANRLGIVRVDNTQAKVLVSDSYYITTSFDWLSFRGEPSRKYRQDDGDLVQDQVLADRAYDKYLAEACSLAVEVVGNLPANYRGLVGASATWTEQGTATPNPDVPRKSRRSAAPSQAERRGTALSKLASGQTVSGPVKKLTTFGAFIDLGGVDGLIHISQLRRSSSPTPVRGRQRRRIGHRVGVGRRPCARACITLIEGDNIGRFRTKSSSAQVASHASKDASSRMTNSPASAQIVKRRCTRRLRRPEARRQMPPRTPSRAAHIRSPWL